MLKITLISTIIFLSIPAFAGNAKAFQRIADKGPTTDHQCINHSGDPLGLTDELMNSIVKKARNSSGLLHLNGRTYVMYGTKNSEHLSTYSLNLCRF